MIYKQNKITFNGSLLKQKFGYDFYEEKYKNTGVVVIFRGDMNISFDREHFFHDYPTFKDSINICWEIPNISQLGNVCFKKLFLYKIKECLENLNIYTNIEKTKKDSILVSKENKKAKEINFCMLKQPDNVFSLGYIGLNNESLLLNDKQIDDLCEKINESFYEIIESSFLEMIKPV
jgi:hypothetical protein